MDMTSPALLELDLVAVPFHRQGCTLGHDNLTQELLDTMVEKLCGCEHIVSDQLMETHFNILLDELFKWFPLSIGCSCFIHIVFPSINLLNNDVDAVAPLEQYRGKVGVPTEVST